MPYGMLTSFDDSEDWAMGDDPQLGPCSLLDEEETMEQGCAQTASEARSEVLRETNELEQLSKSLGESLSVLTDKIGMVLVPSGPTQAPSTKTEQEARTPLGQDLAATRSRLVCLLAALEDLTRRVEL